MASDILGYFIQKELRKRKHDDKHRKPKRKITYSKLGQANKDNVFLTAYLMRFQYPLTVYKLRRKSINHVLRLRLLAVLDVHPEVGNSSL